MLPAILGLGGLTAKIIATAVIPRVVRAISQSFSTTRPAEPCPPSPVEGISSGPEPAPAPVLSGVSGTQIRSRKWGYAGLWHHAPSGLDLATYRLYDAANKRWISRDPLGEGTDRTLYSYCYNNPISLNDPSGLQPPMFDPSGIQINMRSDPHEGTGLLPLTPTQQGNVQNAINTIRGVNPQAGAQLQRAFDSGRISRLGPVGQSMLGGAGGFTNPLNASIYLPDNLLSGDAVDIARTTSHENGHIDQTMLALSALYSIWNTGPRELPAINAELQFLTDWLRKETDPVIRGKIKSRADHVQKQKRCLEDTGRYPR